MSKQVQQSKQVRAQKTVSKFNHLRGKHLEGQKIHDVRAEQVLRAMFMGIKGVTNSVDVLEESFLTKNRLGDYLFLGMYDPFEEEFLAHTEQITACVMLGVNWREIVKLSVEAQRDDGVATHVFGQARDYDFGVLRGKRFGVQPLYINLDTIRQAIRAVLR